MNILVAPDKFKGTVTAPELVQVVSSVLRQYGHYVIGCPLADGGDGTAEILTITTGGRRRTLTVEGPDFTPVEATYGINDQTRSAFIEMATASGLALLPPAERNPLNTSTTGVGMLLEDAIGEGCDHIILGVGGSATNDGGIGAAHAFGYKFLDKSGMELPPLGKHLSAITKIVPPEKLPDITIEVAVDVQNPFCGPNGAAYTYAEQKGANQQEILTLDQGLQNLSKRVDQFLNVNISQLPGSGAAGGLAGGLVAFFGASLRSGVNLVMEQVKFDEKLSDSDLVISGEGRFDETSYQGKVVGEVISRAEKSGKKWLVICEQSTIERENIFSLSQMAGSSREALKRPHYWIENIIKKEVLPYLDK